VFNHPFYMIMNLAVGGNWPGSPDASTAFPQQLVIDYVHVFSFVAGGTGGAITGFAGKCVDVAAANPADGTTVQLYTCNGTNAQQWTRPGDGTVRALGKCLDVSAGSTANGARVQLWTCNGTGAQQWVYTSGRDLVNPQANKCLDVTGVNSADGTPLQLWTCTGGANQKWNAPAAGGGGGGGTPGIQAAPYEYLGWGSPPNPTSVMSASQIDFGKRPSTCWSWRTRTVPSASRVRTAYSTWYVESDGSGSVVHSR